jgi:transcriptional regulator
MYVPPAFAIVDLHELHDVIRASRLGFLVTRSSDRLRSTPLPLFLDEEEGEYGTLYGHLARANTGQPAVEIARGQGSDGAFHGS